jgi:hypothetical protein
MPMSPDCITFVENFLGVQPLEICYHFMVHTMDKRYVVGWQELLSDEGKFINQRGSKIQCHGQVRDLPV